jgi:arylsulfatase
MPTALAASGAEYTGSLDLPGVDMVAQLQSDEPDRRTLFFEHEGNRGVRSGKWKLVSLRDQPWELYDFQDTRTEQENLAGEHPEIVEELSGLWNAWAAANQVTPLPDDYQVGYLRGTDKR